MSRLINRYLVLYRPQVTRLNYLLVYTMPAKSQIKVMKDNELTTIAEVAASECRPLEISQSIDTCGTRCPIPLLRAKQALKLLNVGEHLEVLASDPSAKPDFDSMLRHLPHELVSYMTQSSPKRIDTFIIRKGE